MGASQLKHLGPPSGSAGASWKATTSFARFLGRLYHGVPAPLNRVRDLFLDHSTLPAKMISKGVTSEAQSLLRAILEPMG